MNDRGVQCFAIFPRLWTNARSPLGPIASCLVWMRCGEKAETEIALIGTDGFRIVLIRNYCIFFQADNGISPNNVQDVGQQGM